MTWHKLPPPEFGPRKAQNCGNCDHSSDMAAINPARFTYCTNRASFYDSKLMEKTARCERWAAK